MALVVVIAGLGMLCAVLWYCVVYALPVFVGFSTGFWALNHGAGLGCIIIGLLAGVTTFLLGHLAATSGHSLLRWTALTAFVLPASYAGFSIVDDLAGVTPLWRVLFAAVGAASAGCVTYKRMTASPRPSINSVLDVDRT
ncbi:MAG: hypothetical protein RB191_21490 [Terriglobia bacterium]|nr:hypothetical protein [Terriglobia bacterium]